MLTNTNTEESLIKGILNHGPSILENCTIDPTLLESYSKKLQEEFLHYPLPKTTIDTSEWFIPIEYQNMDIEQFLVDQCPKENYDRLIEELQLYRNHNMLPVLRQMKYLVDTLRSNDVVWGVGRGSSVASYVLYLIGVHKIDSIKYNLPIEEFFKEA
jgi:DNA polymerase III alpha subunit